MSRKRSLTQVLLCFLMLMFISCSDKEDIFPDFHNVDDDTYSISGRVTSNGIGLSNISVHLTGASVASTLTDEDGEYKFDDLDDEEEYSVNPSSGSYIFTPESTDIEIDGSSANDIDFEGESCCGATEKAITAFSFASPAAVGIISEPTHTISITVPSGTNVTALTPTITHTGESISPASGVAQNFTNPIEYTVTAEDSSTQDYTVTVNH